MQMTLIWALGLGALIGSFLNVVIARIPAQIDYAARQADRGADDATAMDDPPPGIAWPGSHCPACKHPIRLYDNIPIVSWLLLRGRCRDCGIAISGRYPATELLTALLTAAIVWFHGPSLATVGLLLLTWWLLALALIDAETQLLPDVLTLSGLWAGLLFSLWSPVVTPAMAIIGAAAGYTALWGLNALYRQWRGHDGLGYGDFKLFALLGAWGGVEALLTTSLVAPILALVVVLIQIPRRGFHARQAMPFGPYLALGGWIAIVPPPSLLHWLPPWG